MQTTIATPQDLRDRLDAGGRADVTVRSAKTGEHVRVVITGRRRKQDGTAGFIPRTQKAGRVGLTTGADVLEVRDPDLEYPDNYVGRYYVADGEWKAAKGADPARRWVAEATILRFALGGVPLGDSEVKLACTCAYCGKKLTDPESIDRGVGPECFGAATGSKATPHKAAA